MALEGLTPAANDNISPEQKKNSLLESGRVVNKVREWIKDTRQVLLKRIASPEDEYAVDQSTESFALLSALEIQCEETDSLIDDAELDPANFQAFVAAKNATYLLEEEFSNAETNVRS